MSTTRREFLQQAALLAGGLSALKWLPESLVRAAGIEAAPGSTFMDAEHVVILMQENRSFDHAFGTLRGVRGFEDPRALELPDGNPVWLQTDAEGHTYAPFNLNLHGTRATWMSDLPHDRESQVAAGNDGRHDRWLKVKQSHRPAYAGMPLTLGYYSREDNPFYHAFADAFTICDQHFCAAQTCTTPNRLFLWTGTVRDPNDPTAPVRLSNDQIDHSSNASWITFPERLEQVGVSWRIYQNEIDRNTGLTHAEEVWLGNYGDNPLEYFTQYHIEFHPTHVLHMQQRVAELRERLETLPQLLGPTLPPGEMTTAEVPADRERAKLETALARAEAELAACSPERFASLSEQEKNIHRRAFTTNVNEPAYRELARLASADGRPIEVPAGDVLHQFRQDVASGQLPAVSWLVAPENFSDHPSAPWYGAWYVSEVLDILTNNPEVWKKTIFILTYDENDGYFDHVPPFVPPHTDEPESGAASAGLATADEFDEKGHAIGLGYRVPMVIASPWSRGGKVCSQVFDHTSVLSFLEGFANRRAKTPVREEHISAWRRTVCGDLSSAFQALDDSAAEELAWLDRDDWIGRIHHARDLQLPSNFKLLEEMAVAEIRKNPAISPLLPAQEPGTRPSCAIPYELYADGIWDAAKRCFRIEFRAADRFFGPRSAGAPFQVRVPAAYLPEDAASYTDAEPPRESHRRWAFAVAAGKSVSYEWPLARFADGRYHLRCDGPNGFHREFRGDAGDPLLDIACSYGTSGSSEKPDGSLILSLSHRGRDGQGSPFRVMLTDMSYGTAPQVLEVPPGSCRTVQLDLTASSRWYDLGLTVQDFPQFSQRYAGRVETGQPGTSDPAIGRGVRSPLAGKS